MKSLLFLFAILFSVGWGAPTVPFEVVNRYPHDTGSFTEGLLYYNGVIYESAGLYGQSSLRKVNLTSGEVLQRIDVPPSFFAEGLVLFHDALFQMTWKENVVFKYDRETFELLNTFSNPYDGWGLTTDGTSLIMSTGSSHIYFVDPTDFTVKNSITVTNSGSPVRNLNELEYINGEIWANVWLTNKIVRIDPTTGNVNSVLDFTSIKTRGAEFNGIAFDSVNQRIFVTGKYWPTLFEIIPDNY